MRSFYLQHSIITEISFFLTKNWKGLIFVFGLFSIPFVYAEITIFSRMPRYLPEGKAMFGAFGLPIFWFLLGIAAYFIGNEETFLKNAWFMMIAGSGFFFSQTIVFLIAEILTRLKNL